MPDSVTPFNPGGQAWMGQAMVMQGEPGDEVAEAVAEVLVLSNMVLWLDVVAMPGGPIRVGQSRVCSKQWALRFVQEYLPLLVEHVTECDEIACGHAGHFMEQVAPL